MRRRIPWLAFAPLLVLAPIAISLGWRNGNYRRTGDSLYDHAATILLDELGRCRPPVQEQIARLFGQSLMLRRKDFDPQCLLRLGPGFESDPRYQEMLLTLGIQEITDGNAMETVQHAPQTPGCMAYLAARLARRNEDAALEACKRGLELDPGNSLFHYQRALILISLGELEEAQEEAELGNRAHNNSMRWAFPLDGILKGRSGTRSANDKVAGILFCLGDQISPHFQVREQFKDLEVAFLIGLRPDVMDAFVTMTRRMSQMEGCSVNQILDATQGVTFLLGRSGEAPEPEKNFHFHMLLDQSQKREATYVLDQMNAVVPTIRQACGNGWNQPEGYFELKDSSWLLDPAQTPLIGIEAPAKYVGQQLHKINAVRTATGALFDCLNPPPFSSWSDGKLAGTPVPDNWQPIRVTEP